MALDHWRWFARKFHLADSAVANAVEEIAERVWGAWKSLPEKDEVPEPVLVRIATHLEKQVTVLGGNRKHPARRHHDDHHGRDRRRYDMGLGRGCALALAEAGVNVVIVAPI